MRRSPAAPKHLNDAARAVWKRLIGELPDHETGTLLVLEQFCAAWSKWLAARGEDSKLRWSRASRQWLAELKLTPRTRPARKTIEDSADPILKLIHRKAE